MTRAFSGAERHLAIGHKCQLQVHAFYTLLIAWNVLKDITIIISCMTRYNYPNPISSFRWTSPRCLMWPSTLVKACTNTLAYTIWYRIGSSYFSKVDGDNFARNPWSRMLHWRHSCHWQKWRRTPRTWCFRNWRIMGFDSREENANLWDKVGGVSRS